MAKFNIEVELDWMNDEYTIDEELRERIVDGVEECTASKSDRRSRQSG